MSSEVQHLNIRTIAKSRIYISTGDLLGLPADRTANQRCLFNLVVGDVHLLRSLNVISLAGLPDRNDSLDMQLKEFENRDALQRVRMMLVIKG